MHINGCSEIIVGELVVNPHMSYVVLECVHLYCIVLWCVVLCHMSCYIISHHIIYSMLTCTSDDKATGARACMSAP